MSISKEAWKKLQNGSDVRGVATEGVSGQPVNLTPEVANCIARAFAHWLSEKYEKPVESLSIGVGHDSRISAPALTRAVLSGIQAAGSRGISCGLASTPAMYMSLLFPETAYDGSIMITASHLPYNRNGLKFFDQEGGLEHEDISALLEKAAELEPGEPCRLPENPVDLLSLYGKHLCEKIRDGAGLGEKPLSGLRIVVDAGNGAGGFFVEKVLFPLGADTTGSQFLEPDGNFPNHIPNPENPAAMEAIRSAVLENKADLGLIFDTDVDRMSAVLSDGTEVNRDSIIAMMAAIAAKDCPGGTIVTDSVTSDKLTKFLEQSLNLRHHRFKRGYKNVINECKRLNQAGILSPLAIETSGHGAFSENFYLDDGAYMAVKLLVACAVAAKSGNRPDTLIGSLEPQFECREYRLNLLTEDFSAYGKQVLVTFEERAKAAGFAVAPNSYEGVRLSFSGETEGWLLLRMSLHDPLMPMNLEGNRRGDCEKILDMAKSLLTGFAALDLSVLENSSR